MLRFRLQELLADRQFQTGKRLTLTQLAATTGISRVTLSKMINQRGYGTLTQHLDVLCRYFSCKIEELVEYVPEAELKASAVRQSISRPHQKARKAKPRSPRVD